MSEDVPAPAARVEISGGGAVPADVLAAVVVALTPAAGDGDGAPAPAGPPAWARAALLEGVGYRTPSRPSDLQRITVLGG